MFELGIGTFPLELYNLYNKLCWKSENIMILGENKGENATILQKKINAVKNNNHKRKYSKRKCSK